MKETLVSTLCILGALACLKYAVVDYGKKKSNEDGSVLCMVIVFAGVMLYVAFRQWFP